MRQFGLKWIGEAEACFVWRVQKCDLPFTETF